MAIELKWYRQPGNGISLTFQRRSDQPPVARLTITDNFLTEHARNEVFIETMNALAPYTHLNAFNYLSEETREFFSIRHQTLSKLESALEQLAVDFSKRQTAQDEYLRHQQVNIQEVIKTEKETLSAEFRKRLQSLEEREQQLKLRAEELDASNNRDARRKLQKELRDTLLSRMDKFKLSNDTESKRRPIQYAFWAVLAITASAAIYFAIGSWLYPPTAPSWTPILRISISLTTFVSFAIYYIRWQDRWLQRHAREEFHHQRLNVDLIRASWLVETALESSTAEGVKIPNDLLNRLAVGLFEEERATAGQARHPAEDALAMLLGTPRELKVDYPGGSATYAQRALRRVARPDTKAPQSDE